MSEAVMTRSSSNPRPLVLQLVAGVALVTALVGLHFFIGEWVNPYHARVVVNCGIAMLLAMSLNLVNGCAGQFSLGHAGFMAVGAYTGATVTVLLGAHLPFLVSWFGAGVATVAGGLVAALAGYLVGLPSLRLRGDYLAIVTLGFGEIIRIVILNVPALGGAVGLPGIPRLANFFWVYAWVVVTFVVLKRLIESSYGRAILAIREDEVSAQAMGIDVARYKVFAFVVSSFFAGVAGALFAHYQGFIDPNGFNFQRSVEVVIMVVIGGMGSLSGSILGAIAVTLLPETLRVFDKYRLVIFPTLLILMMLLRPMGILGHRELWQLVPWKRGNGGKSHD
jgi:branched-chain amino acid transport system permease protein